MRVNGIRIQGTTISDLCPAASITTAFPMLTSRCCGRSIGLVVVRSVRTPDFVGDAEAYDENTLKAVQNARYWLREWTHGYVFIQY